MPRLFTGLEIPHDIQAVLTRLKAPVPGARWVEPENLHLTLRFAGDIENHIAADFADALAGIDCRPFELRLSGVGAFGGNDPRVIWAGVEAGAELERLARAHERAARAAGLPPDARGWKPHVTLARLRYGKPDVVARYLQSHAAFRSPAFVAERFVLFSSQPRTGGGPYVVEQAFPFAGTSGGWEGEY